MLREHSQQQRDSQLWAQALQQLQEAGTTAGNAKVGEESAGGLSLVTGHRHHLGPACIDLNTCAHLPGTYHVLGHQSPPNLGTYLRGRGEDTGWQRSRLS